MTWHTATVPTDGLDSLLTAIRSSGGTIISSRPQPDEVCVVWTTAAAAPVHRRQGLSTRQ